MTEPHAEKKVNPVPRDQVKISGWICISARAHSYVKGHGCQEMTWCKAPLHSCIAHANVAQAICQQAPNVETGETRVSQPPLPKAGSKRVKRDGHSCTAMNLSLLDSGMGRAGSFHTWLLSLSLSLFLHCLQRVSWGF